MNCVNFLLHNLYHVMLSVTGLQSLTKIPTTMFRYFKIETLEGIEFFQMFSKFSTEFGDVVLLTHAPLSISTGRGSIFQQVAEGNYQDVPFDSRINEMRYFLDCFSMFNPNIKQTYEEKTQQPETPADFPF